ncbi:transporter substrate-binding domain-containing protein, partial [Rhizobium ruizarguesonis]
MEFQDPATNTLTGVDVALGNAIGAQLGVKINWQEIAFEQMVTAVSTQRVDLVLSGMPATAERPKVVSFLDSFPPG